MTSGKWKTGWWAGALPMLYLATLSATPRAGAPAAAISRHVLQSEPPLLHPWYDLLAELVAALPGGSLTLRLNLLNLLLTVTALAALAPLLRQAASPPGQARSRSAEGWLPLAYLALSPPVWWCAVQAGPAGLGFLIAVAAVRCLRSWLPSPSPGSTAVLGMLCGMAVTETVPGFPLLLGVAGMMLLARGLSSRHHAHGGWFAAGSLAGVLPWLPAWAAYAGVMDGGAAAGWVEAARHSLGAAAARVHGGLPGLGWLSLVLLTGLPGVAAVLIRLRHRSRGTVRAPIRLLAAVLIGVLLLYLFPFPFAPYRLVADPASLAVLSLLPAFGLAGCIGLLSARRSSRSSLAPRLTRVAVAAVLVLAAGWQIMAYNATRSSPAWQAARLSAQANPEVAHLVVDPEWEALYRIAFHDENRDPRFLRLRHPTPKQVRTFLAADLEDPELALLAGVSPMAAARVLVDPGAGFHRTTAVHGSPSLWQMAGQSPVPRLLLYRAAGPEGDAPPLALVEQLRAASTPVRKTVDGPVASWLPEGTPDREAVTRALARAANDLGVALETIDPDAAGAAYRLALSLQPDHPAALLNLATWQGDRTGHIGSGELLNRLSETWFARQPAGDVVSRILDTGRIRNRTTRQRLVELSGLQAGTTDPDPFWASVASAVLAGEHTSLVDRLERRVRQDPDDARSWMLLGALAWDLGNREVFARCVDRMTLRGEGWPPLLSRLAREAVDDGQPDKAAELLDRAQHLWPLHAGLLEQQVRLGLHLGQPDRVDRHLAELLSLDPGNAWANYALGVRAFSAGNLGQAEVALLRSVGRMPVPVACNNLAWILLGKGQLAGAERYARQAIALDPFGAAQWNTLTEVLKAQGRTAEAAVADATSRRLLNSAGEIME